MRDDVVTFIRKWSSKSGVSVKTFCNWLCIRPNKLDSWSKRFGLPNQHNAEQPKTSWLLEWEKQAIIDYFYLHQGTGYRRLCYMMLDENIAGVSPSSVYRVLSSKGLLNRWNNEPSKKGNGFEGPQEPHEHWHLDITYLNLGGTFYYLIAIIDGYSRYLIQWDIRQSMNERDVQIVVQLAKEAFPEACARVITDNGKQLIAKDLKDLFRIHGMTHVRTSPYYPQSNGKIERWNGTLKRECIRPKCPSNLEEAKRMVGNYIDEYNNKRLHSAIGFVTPRDRLMGLDKQIWEERKEKLQMSKINREMENKINTGIVTKTYL
jgi:transposase InsO family protein